MLKTLYVDDMLLDEKISESGLKVGYICDMLGISRQAFHKKRKGTCPLKASEVYVLCDLLGINDAGEKNKIFYPKG